MRYAPRLLFPAIVLLMARLASAQEFSLRPVIGGLPADSGFAAGIELLRTRVAKPMDVRLTAIGSVKKYQFLEAGLELPALGPRWLSLDVSGRFRNYPEEDYWGLGQDSRSNQRSNFLYEDIGLNATASVSAGRARLGISHGFAKVNTGPGRDREFPSIADSLHARPSLRTTAVFFQYDSTDNEFDPRTGGRYGVRWTAYESTLQRYEIDVRHFVPVAAGDRIGLRAQTIFTGRIAAGGAPFFLLPGVGGTDTVRGFHQNRFRDRNALILNLEYRRVLAGFIDGVAFGDIGRVSPRPGGLTFKDMAGSAGFGARIRIGRRVFLGADLGFSREGARLWFRSSHTF